MGNGVIVEEGTSQQIFEDPQNEMTKMCIRDRNYLAGALKPVGQALYIWGGGWYDSTRIGVSPKMCIRDSNSTFYSRSNEL